MTFFKIQKLTENNPESDETRMNSDRPYHLHKESNSFETNGKSIVSISKSNSVKTVSGNTNGFFLKLGLPIDVLEE